MNILAIQKKIKRNNLASLLYSVLGSSPQFDNPFIETLVQKGADGRIIEDINGMILGGGNKGKGGSILGVCLAGNSKKA